MPADAHIIDSTQFSSNSMGSDCFLPMIKIQILAFTSGLTLDPPQPNWLPVSLALYNLKEREVTACSYAA